MRVRRNNALTELKTLAENVKNCKLVLSDRTLKEWLEQMLMWANNDGVKSSLTEVEKRINHIKLKVRNQVMFFCHPMT